MQWTGQKVMFDLRSQIFRHLQRMHIGFYDKNPVGRLVTRVTTDVDALNEMFTSGVVSIFEDIFVLAGIMVIMLHMNWRLALITFAVLPLIAIATKMFRDKVRDSYRRIRVAIARINSYLQEHVSGMVVLQLFNREKRAYRKFSDINAVHMEAFKDAIMAYAVYYPVVEVAFVHRHRLRDLVRRQRNRPRYWSACASGPRFQGHAGRSGGLHPVCPALLPSHSGPERKIQHPAVGHGVERAGFQAAGYAPGDHLARGDQNANRPRPGRV